MNKTVLQAVTGSRAYGLHHEKSDTDRMGIFVAPTIDVAGLHWTSEQESWSDAGPEGDDNTKHEIGKFLRLVLKSNPTLIELLFMNEYEILDDVGQGLIDLRHKMLYEKGIRGAYLGYATAQYDRVLREYPNHKPKMARHCLRISQQGLDLLTTGEFNIHVGDPTPYFELTDLPMEEMAEKMRNVIGKIETCDSVLPETYDYHAVSSFLREVRRNHVEIH